jgi:hypothetical protein
MISDRTSKMMKAQMTEELLDLFNWRNRYQSRSAYGGVGVMYENENKFYEHFKSLAEAEKQEAANVIVAGAIGQNQQLSEYLGQTASLMMNLCLRRHTRYFLPHLEMLEREFNDTGNLKAWAEAEDLTTLPGGLEFKKDWHYSLLLFQTLRMLKSSHIGNSQKFLIENAKSEQFRKRLGRSKKDRRTIS